MGGGPESRCEGHVYGADGAVRRTAQCRGVKWKFFEIQSWDV